jgi:predicted ATP-dependent Lon-type protease
MVLAADFLHFFEPLGEKYIDSAFLDRIYAFNPGWEVASIRDSGRLLFRRC